MNIVDFGRGLLETGDLDPLYLALTKKEVFKDSAQLDRFLVAYWCFYHAGFAAYLSEKDNPDAFWARFYDAAVNMSEAPVGGRWPRGTERRHFRGQIAVKSWHDMTNHFPKPEMMVDFVTGRLHGYADKTVQDTGTDFKSVTSAAKSISGFGPWIAFKIADMTDRVLGIPVEFKQQDVFMFDDPVEGALKLFDELFPSGQAWVGSCEEPRAPTKQEKIDYAVEYLQKKLGHYNAPPHNDRKINIQEIETILCKWKSHMKGHYEVGKDIREITHGLEPWARECRTASNLLMAMPKRCVFNPNVGVV